MSAELTNIGVNYFLPFSLAMITLAMGLALVLNDFANLWHQPKAALIGLLGQIILLPIIALVIAAILGLTPAFAVGLVLVAACPGGAHSNLFTSLAKGDVALSVSLTAISGLICIVSIPFYVYLSTIIFTTSTEVIHLPIKQTIMQLLGIVIIPLVIGMSIRHFSIRIASIAEKVIKPIAVFLLVIIIIGAISNGWENVLKYAQEVGLAVILLNLSAMLTGATIALKAKLPGPQVTAITMEVGIQNTTLAFGIAMTLLDNFMIAIPAMVYALWVYIAAFSMVLISRRYLTKDKTDQPNKSI